MQSVPHHQQQQHHHVHIYYYLYECGFKFNVQMSRWKIIGDGRTDGQTHGAVGPTKKLLHYAIELSENVNSVWSVVGLCKLLLVFVSVLYVVMQRTCLSVAVVASRPIWGVN